MSKILTERLNLAEGLASWYFFPGFVRRAIYSDRINAEKVVGCLVSGILLGGALAKRLSGLETQTGLSYHLANLAMTGNALSAGYELTRYLLHSGPIFKRR